MMIMKKFEVLQELPKCDAETQSKQMLLGKKKKTFLDLLDTRLPQIEQFIKSKIE